MHFKFTKNLSLISALHYSKLIFRSGLFMTAAAIYLINRIRNTGSLFGGIENRPIILGVIWLVFVVEMIFRFSPSRFESMGCQKQFAHNYIPTGAESPDLLPTRTVILIALGWLGFNAIFGVLYFIGIIDRGILLLISLAFSVCDMICILFFCPFQTWFMKNKCCGSCRIYNWDYAMMFTPLIFIPSPYTWSILAAAAALLVHWEISVYRHGERFSEVTNACLSCTHCKEKLCHHKKQLRSFLRRNRHRLHLLGNSAVAQHRLPGTPPSGN